MINRLEVCDKDVDIVQNQDYVDMFLAAKKIEGCTERTIKAYRSSLENLFEITDTAVRKITTETIRQLLIDYQGINNCSKVTVDNLRRNLSSFFSWLVEENYIIKNPVRRIHKVKVGKKVKDTISDENIEIMRDHCKNARDIAMIDLLYSTGMRIGEMVNLNIYDVNFEERECIVYGKGDKERRVYFDAKRSYI